MQIINTKTLHYIKDNKKQKIFTTAENLQKAIQQFFNWYNTTSGKTNKNITNKKIKGILKNENIKQKHKESKNIYW